jgi:hypothetical protein
MSSLRGGLGIWAAGRFRGSQRRLTTAHLVVAAFGLLLAAMALAVAGSTRSAAAAPAAGCESDEVVDLTTALDVSETCSVPVRVSSMTTEVAEFVAQPNGTVTAELYTGPVRVRDGAGGWVDVDLNLERRPDGSVAARVHPNGLVLSGRAGEGEHDLARLGSGSQQLTVGWRGALPEPKIDGMKATCVDVKPGVDLVIETTRTGFETFFIVKNRAAADHVRELSLPWRTTMGPGRSEAGGGMAFGTADVAAKVPRADGRAAPRKEVPMAMMAPALMWDATINPHTGEPATRRQFDVSIADRGNGRSDVALRPDADFLADESTVYPVTIDPQWDINPVNGTHDTWAENTGGTGWNSTELKLGTHNGGGEIARSYIFWDLAQFHGAKINWATLNLYETWAFSCRDAE